MKLAQLTKILNVGMQRIVAFLEKHPELGEVPHVNANSIVNDKQVAAVTEYFKDQNYRTLNQSIRFKKKTKEEKERERKEKEKLRQELRQQMKNDILKEIRKTVDEKRRENQGKKGSHQNQYLPIKENITHEIIDKSNDKQHSNSELVKSQEQITDLENGVFRIHKAESKSDIKVVDKIDLDSLNLSTRPRKKTMEEQRAERKKQENLRKERRQQHKDSIINQILKAINESNDKKLQVYDNTRLNKLTRILNIGMKHIISFLENHPELGVAPKLNPNSKLNEKQVAATIKYFKNEENRPQISIKNNSDSETEETNKHNTSTIYINPNNLQFKQGYVKFNLKNNVFILKEGQFNKELNKIKTDQTIFEGETVELVLNNNTKSFNFGNCALYDRLKQLGIEMRAKKIEERKEKREKEKERQKVDKTIIVHAKLMEFKFYNGLALYTYNNEQFSFRDYQFIKDYNKLFTIAKTNIDCKEALKRKLIKLTLNLSNKTFVCNRDFDIHNYLHLCMRKFSMESTNFKDSQYLDNYDNLEHIHSIYCKIENIEFFDGYYKIWIIKNGVKIYNINPLIIKDINSLACLQIASKYFAARLPHDIMIIYTNNQVVRLVNEFKLHKYVETLKMNKEIPYDWWNRSDNQDFKTLENYRKIPNSIVNKEVSYKNVYIDYLTSYQGENPLLIAYEIFNGQEEKCFVFNISIGDKRSAIIYENININRATNVFIIDKQNYEESMNLIFNYFTDKDLSRKRMSIRTNQNPPEKFKAIEVKTINHDNLSLWINKLNELIIPSSKQIVDDKTPEHIHFFPGLKLKSGNTERVNTQDTIIVKNLHDEIKEKLYLQLSKKYGADFVGTEISIGQKKIDLVVKNQDSYDLYEVKTNQEVRICIREAMGQIIDYAFFECRDKVGKMTIVGPSQISPEASEYLYSIRLKHNLPIYYESI